MSTFPRILFSAGLIIALILPGKCQLYINEFMASNGTTIEDTDFHDYSDWLEIYNAGSSSINLKGYFLTDNLNKPDKWEIPADLNISAGGYILIWADDLNQENHTSFKLAIEGEELGIYDANLNAIDTLTYTHQKSDVSFGRSAANINQWVFFSEPTPGNTNTGLEFSNFVKQFPEFSVAGKIFDESFLVSITSGTPAEIRYTIDGSEPNSSSPGFTSPILIDQTAILRARIFKPNELPGPIVTHSYFLNVYENRKLPIVSIVSEPDNFWSPTIGIYTQDFKPDWEIPINIELFENDGSDRAGFNEGAGAKINGLNAWKLPQKMLGIYFRGRYGSGKLNYPLFFDRDRREFDSFALRASGSDWSYTLFRDILGQGLTDGYMDVDTQGERPCMVYINGAYMGIHNIRSKIDEDFITGNHHLEQGTFDMVENEDLVEAGTLTEYGKLKALCAKDLSIQANYDAVVEIMDIANFTDYVIAEIYVRNTSIGHNVMAWKPHNKGKWRWILMDLDRGFFSAKKDLIDYFSSKDVVPLANLLQNEGYQTYFRNRLASHLITTYDPERVSQLIDSYAARIRQEIPYHVERWKGTTSGYGDAMPSVAYWEQAVQSLKVFANERPSALLADLQNYGSVGLVNLAVTRTPRNTGEVTLNGLPLTISSSSGQYLKNAGILLAANPNNGYEFTGWEIMDSQILVARESTWSYLDDGTDPGSNWLTPGYDLSSWHSGPAQLGYGDGDEATEVNYGGDSGSKYMTTYFRKPFSLNPEEASASGYTIKVLYDDGAIVYLNGQEVVRANMPTGEVNFQTPASTALGGFAEEVFTSFKIDPALFTPGNNLLAVEIHQSGPTSSDISFDLELTAFVGDATTHSTENPMNLTLVNDLSVQALFSETGECVLPNEIQSDTTLSMDCSPYFINEDLYIRNGAALTIDPGVELMISKNHSIYIHGQLIAEGTAESPIVFKPEGAGGNAEWGALIFEKTTMKSFLKHVEIQGATSGINAVNFPAAISSFKADLELDHVVIEDVHRDPVFSRYSSIRMTNSKLHSKITGDLINVKYGDAYIANCEFHGNEQSDTDAIDLDGVNIGVVKNCRIYNLLGSNSDGIDIGEQSTHILIDSLVVYNITDKGISIGQRSSATVTNSLFLNCDLGVGIKDSSWVNIDRSTFYGNNYAVASFEKNLGRAGGNAAITNSILSNSAGGAIQVDSHSILTAKFSLSDNEVLKGDPSNLLLDPKFKNPTQYNFQLMDASPAKGAGLSNGDLGVYFSDLSLEPAVEIAGIFTNGGNYHFPEFLMLVNPGSSALDLSGYSMTKGVTMEIPDGVMIGAHDTLFLTNLSSHAFWNSTQKSVYEWADGKLSNNGESLELKNKYGMIVDYIEYDETTWPSLAGSSSKWELINDVLDNHFSTSWKAVAFPNLSLNLSSSRSVRLFPNPTRDVLHLSYPVGKSLSADIYSIDGRFIRKQKLNASGTAFLDISNLPDGVYLVRMEGLAFRVIKSSE